MRIQPPKSFLSFLLLAVSGILVFSSCNSDSSPSSRSNGTAAREFVSGNIALGKSFTHVFESAKVIPYYCRYHGAPSGFGMSGVITVAAGGTPRLTTVSITSLSLPDLSITVGDTVTWINNQTMLHTVESDN